MKPIKRVGKPMGKDLNKLIVEENQTIIKDGCYAPKIVDIAKEMAYAMGNTKYYPGANEIDVEVCVRGIVGCKVDCHDYTICNKGKMVIDVRNQSTQEAIARVYEYDLKSTGKAEVVALNFANAVSPGGGYLKGANAQEEDLCRCSSLYQCLCNTPQFFDDNNKNGNHVYTDGVIYSPNVPFFRGYKDANNPYALLSEPYYGSIITCPAPFAYALEDKDKKDFPEVFRKRITRILKVAIKYNHKNIILGAWGCGAFGNDPVMVAEAFKDCLDKLPMFDYVCFAVYDRTEKQTNYKTFAEILGSKETL